MPSLGKPSPRIILGFEAADLMYRIVGRSEIDREDASAGNNVEFVGREGLAFVCDMAGHDILLSKHMDKCPLCRVRLAL
jgi:hypothetical protein